MIYLVQRVRNISNSDNLCFLANMIIKPLSLKLFISQNIHILMEVRLRNVPPKRIFGKDITNVEQRRSKNASISEKTSLMSSARNKSHSFDKKNISFEQKDPIVEYQTEILSFMLSLQRKEKTELTSNITSDMRQILLDWLIDVHLSFQLREQTLYLALAYINEYAAIHEITKHEYQLVGITCLWIASKYEEIYPPRMKNYIEVTDSSYTISELKAMEGKILLGLKFNLNFTTPLQILEGISEKWPHEMNKKLTKESQKTLCMCKYLLQLSLFEGLGKNYCMKTLVLTALMLSDSILKVKSDSRALDNDKIDKQTLMSCFKDMCTAMQNASRPNLKLKAIKKKYSTQRYMEVSKFRIQPR